MDEKFVAFLICALALIIYLKIYGVPQVSALLFIAITIFVLPLCVWLWMIFRKR